MLKNNNRILLARRTSEVMKHSVKISTFAFKAGSGSRRGHPRRPSCLTFHEDLVLGDTLEQFVELGVVFADGLCRGTGQSHEQLLGGPARLHRTGSARRCRRRRRRHHPLPQRAQALHQAQHVGSVHTHTLSHIQGLEQAAARHTLLPCRWSVVAGTSGPHANTHTWL